LRRNHRLVDFNRQTDFLGLVLVDVDDERTHPASTPGRRDGLPRSAQAATAALDCWFAFQFHGSRSATLLAG
jgi:hypothetical protein